MADGIDLVYAVAARHDRFKADHLVEVLGELYERGRYDEVLKVYDANIAEGLGMDALLVRAVALAKLERMEEAIAASGPVFGARVATRGDIILRDGTACEVLDRRPENGGRECSEPRRGIDPAGPQARGR